MIFLKRPKYPFSLKTKDEIWEWEDQFECLRSKILVSADPKRGNYTRHRFDLRSQEEITVLFIKEKLVAFSSLCSRDFYPLGVSRILNRMWKASELRTVEKPYDFVSREMLRVQLDKAKSLNKDQVFVSTEGQRRRWLGLWVSNARSDNSKWILEEGFCQVAPGEDQSCWQNVARLPLSESIHSPFARISYDEWTKKSRELRN
jgi:hypothetical protein